eukprot:5894700-Prymnesium_polylepis.1
MAGSGSEPARVRAVRLLLGDMEDAVPETSPASAYHLALRAAGAVVAQLDRGERPTDSAWRQARTALSGMLPAPTAAQWRV